MHRELKREHWPVWIAQSADPRVIALRDATTTLAAACAGSNVNDRFHYGETLLHTAAMFARTEAAAFLLEKGADIEAQNKSNWTPLLLAVQYSQIEIANFLIERGARLEYRAVPNLTEEELAAHREEYRRAFQNVPSLGLPIISNAVKDPAFVDEMVKQMIDTLIAPHQECAINHCHDLEMLQLFVGKHRCEVNIHDRAGYWPLKSFAETGDCAAIKYLLENGADVDFTSTGDTALHTAVRHPSPQCVRILLQRGANPNQQDVDGHTPLHGVRDLETLEILLEAGADPRISDQIGSRPSAWIEDRALKNRLRAAERDWDRPGG